VKTKIIGVRISFGKTDTWDLKLRLIQESEPDYYIYVEQRPSISLPLKVSIFSYEYVTPKYNF